MCICWCVNYINYRMHSTTIKTEGLDLILHFFVLKYMSMRNSALVHILYMQVTTENVVYLGNT